MLKVGRQFIGVMENNRCMYTYKPHTLQHTTHAQKYRRQIKEEHTAEAVSLTQYILPVTFAIGMITDRVL